MSDILFLGSESKKRQELLRDAKIPFRLIKHSSSELETPWTGDFVNYVKGIASHKMESLILPDINIPQEHIFLLTADSLVQIPETGQILCKPRDIANAKEMLFASYDREVHVVTACCLEKRVRTGNKWVIKERHTIEVGAFIVFSVPPDEVDTYLKECPAALNSSGAGIAEGYGNNYFASVRGSYTAMRGLPIFELRGLLKQIGFVI